MKVTVLGAGGAFATIEQGNSAFLVETEDRKILIDCGMTVPYVLRDEMGIPLQSITDIIITHAHADHIGGLEQLLYSNKYMGQNPKPNIYMTKDVAAEVTGALAPGLSYSTEGRLWVEDFFDEWHAPAPDRGIRVGDIPLTFYAVDHAGEMPAAGFRLGPLVVSGDTNTPLNVDSELITHIFHEAEFGFKSGVHCPIDVLRDELPQDTRRKMWLYHYPASLRSLEAATGVAVKGFAGLLKKGDVFNLEAHVDA